MTEVLTRLLSLGLVVLAVEVGWLWGRVLWGVG